MSKLFIPKYTNIYQHGKETIQAQQFDGTPSDVDAMPGGISFKIGLARVILSLVEIETLYIEARRNAPL